MRGCEQMKFEVEAFVVNPQQYVMTQAAAPREEWGLLEATHISISKPISQYFRETRDVLRTLGGIVTLVGALFCSRGIAVSEEYTIINTGIKGGGCWYDDAHFVVVKGEQPAPGKEFEVEGLYYLDPRKPNDLSRIDLSPIEPAIQRQIRDVSCQNETLLFYVMAPDRKTSKLYGIKIGGQPELIADMRWARPSAINLKGQYVLGNKLTVDKGV